MDSRISRDEPLIYVPLYGNYKSTASSVSDFLRANHSFAASYVPKYKELPNAVHADRNKPPRKKPTTLRSPYICFVTPQELILVVSADLLLSLPPPIPCDPAMSIILVLTTSLGVVMKAANAPAVPALPPAMIPVSAIPLVLSSLPSSLAFHNLPLKFSNTGNCNAVNGRFRATSAVYPVNNLRGASLPASCRNARRDVDELDEGPNLPLLLFALDFLEESCRSICAFCLMTSAGARTRQDTTSAVADADE